MTGAARLTSAGLLLMFAATAASAQQITADRPGIGSDPEVVPQFTVQAELGTDNKEVRLGVLPRFELSRDNTSWGAKLGLIDSKTLKASLKLSYDRDLHTVVEVPASYKFNDDFGINTTVIWSRSMQTYAAEFDFTPTPRLTIMPTMYYEAKIHAAFFVAWVLPGSDNWQIDVGYDQHKVSAGISTAIDFAHLLGKH